MCLLVVAWLSHPRYRLVVAGNRDEFHDRPSAPLGWWSDVPGVLAGRDLRASGTWLGVARSDRFGIVTNFRNVEAPAAAESPSRGQLVPRFLREDRGPGAFLDELHATADRFAGFNLLLGDSSSLHYYSNATGQPPRALPPGIYGLSNHQLDEPWPKLVRTRQRFAAATRPRRPGPGSPVRRAGRPHARRRRPGTCHRTCPLTSSGRCPRRSCATRATALAARRSRSSSTMAARASMSAGSTPPAHKPARVASNSAAGRSDAPDLARPVAARPCPARNLPGTGYGQRGRRDASGSRSMASIARSPTTFAAS